MQDTCPATDVQVGYHPSGFRIDKTTSPLNRYTHWTITSQGTWQDPTPVCFHSLPTQGWIKTDRFDWSEHDTTKE